MRAGATSRPWGRLKPVELDLLESIGLVSKGDNSLLDHKTQERFYRRIVEKYMSFCSAAKGRQDLVDQFASLSVTQNQDNGASSASTIASSSSSSSTIMPSPKNAASSKDGLLQIMTSLRKLREGIVASKRADEFAKQAYLFNVRAALLVKHHESYMPAVLHLLRFIHPRRPLSGLELREVTGYLVLDMACRRGELEAAYRLRHRYRLQDGKVDAVLRALVHDDYVTFRRVQGQVDGHVVRIMEFAEDGMRRKVLKRIGAAYLMIDVGFLELTTAKKWPELVKEGVEWQRDGERVTLRTIKAK